MKCGLLFYFQWHITEKCYNDCRHCYSKGKRMKEETSMEDFVSIFDDLYSLCQRWQRGIQVTLIGGDPLLHPKFCDFVDHLNKYKNTRILVAGNPETLATEMIKWLKPRIFAFQLSVDGLQDNHDYFRYPGSYQIVMDKLREASNSGMRIHIMTTVSQRNLFDLVLLMHEVYNKGCHRWAFSRYVPPVGQKSDIISADYQEVLRQIDENHKPYLKEGHDDQTKDPLWFPLRNTNKKLEPNPDRCQRDGCGIGSPALGMLPDNTVMACRRHEGSVLGKWRKPGDLLYFMIDSPKMNELRNIEAINHCKDCHFLYYCRGCRAIGYSVRGNLNDYDPTCWLHN